MPKPVIILRGFPRSGEPVAQRMLEDLSAVASLSDDQVDELRSKLSAAGGFLDPKGLASLVKQVLGDERLAQAVQATLRNVTPDDVDFLTESFERAAEGAGPRLDEGTVLRLKQILPRLVSDVPALRRYEKAEHLVELTGHQLETMDLICDLRPIFDDARKEVEGLFPYTRLHLTVTGANGLPRSFEAELSANQVSELREKAVKAEAKLGALRSKVNEWLPGGLPSFPTR